MTKPEPTPEDEEARALHRRERSELRHLRREALVLRKKLEKAEIASSGAVGGKPRARDPVPAMPDPSTPEGREAFARAGFAFIWRLLHGDVDGTNLDRLSAARETRMAAGWGKEAPRQRDTSLPLGSILRPAESDQRSEGRKPASEAPEGSSADAPSAD